MGAADAVTLRVKYDLGSGLRPSTGSFGLSLCAAEREATIDFIRYSNEITLALDNQQI